VQTFKETHVLYEEIQCIECIYIYCFFKYSTAYTKIAKLAKKAD